MDPHRIAIGSDHAGYELKEILKARLSEKGYEVRDKGAFSEERADYPDHAHEVARAIRNGEAELGCIICGSGNGINMSANKHQGIRSALCWCEEIARLARRHNDANILALPGRFVHAHHAELILDAFLSTAFEGGRHENRVVKIDPRAENVG
ncbi:MAG: ribose 5-phosphate isomerase B [Flavobacteriales bacterium]